MAKRDLLSQFGKVIKEARLTAGLSQEELAFQSDLDRTYISMIERSIKVPTISTLVKLAEPLSVTPAQLLNRAQQLEDPNYSPKSKKNSAPISFYGTSVSCGKPITDDFIIEKELSLDEIMIRRPGDTFFIKASGDSMSPSIWDKDILIVLKDPKPKNGSIILAQIEDEFSVKRYFKTPKGIRLIPDNQNYKELIISNETKFIVCGVVIGISRLFNS